MCGKAFLQQNTFILMASIIVLLFCIYLFLRSKKGSLARFIALLFVVSLLGYLLFFVSNDFHAKDLLHALWIIITLSAIVVPWKDYTSINSITTTNSSRADRLATILSIFCILLCISCGILSYYVLSIISNINEFKYGGDGVDFYYSLGIDLHGFLLTTKLYPLGYLLIPFVFYYIGQRRKWKAFLCFLGSMLPVFYGLTYFSRSHMTHFVLTYAAAYILMRGVFTKRTRRKILGIMVVFGVAAIVGFSAITTSRFEDHTYSSGENNIEINTTSSSVLSTVDYLSQWWPNSETLFGNYTGETMHGMIMTGVVNDFFTTFTFGLIPNQYEIRDKRWNELMKDKAIAFIGVGTYTLYDVGIIGGIILYVIYFFLVIRQKPKNGTMSLTSLMMVFSLLPVPLYAIFYSGFDIMIVLLLFYIPISMYLKAK